MAERYEQCFICNQWQPTRLMRGIQFNELEELVCLACKMQLDARTDNLEQIQFEEDIDVTSSSDGTRDDPEADTLPEDEGTYEAGDYYGEGDDPEDREPGSDAGD